VVDHHHDFALGSQFPKNAKENSFGFLIYPNEGLIKKVDIGFLGQGTGQKYPLLLPPERAPMRRSRNSAIPTRSRAASATWRLVAEKRLNQPVFSPGPSSPHPRLWREGPVDLRSLGHIGYPVELLRQGAIAKGDHARHDGH
jgi:hypothetical protein